MPRTKMEWDRYASGLADGRSGIEPRSHDFRYLEGHVTGHQEALSRDRFEYLAAHELDVQLVGMAV